MSQALYRKYRSKSLRDVIGQRHVTDILAKNLAQGRIAHAYLLTGPRGVGKTSIARILAHDINKLPYTDEQSHLDIVEIDAASHNGVDHIRELRDKAQIAPSSAAKKIYIIDEVHMLSKAAFNALLKTLEEPPAHVVFILATTEVDKVPETIRSRTQHFQFRLISTDQLQEHLATIAAAEHIHIETDALRLVAERGRGSFRDSISLLDQLASLSDETTPITRELVEDVLGLASQASIDALIVAVKTHSLPTLIPLLDTLEHQGIDGKLLAEQVIATVRRQLFEDVSMVHLLDDLLDVPQAAQPHLKLLTVLMKHTQPQKVPKTAALHASHASVSATIPSLERQATKPTPKITHAAPAAATPAPEAQAVSKAVPPVAPTAPLSKKHTAPHQELNWQEFVEHTRTHHVALYSVLSKCHHELEGDTLTVYTGNAFYKKKLDDPKYLQKVAEMLTTMGAADLTIVTIPTPPPPKDSQAAAVAAIMGGGEEVSL